ncbi:MAG: helix-turn-helix domain-containing protein [Alphaproteobacteria bacterium]|nr:MAG: helix-turn-helix domain-containing protein [Alphaproteobacteria bacterium]
MSIKLMSAAWYAPLPQKEKIVLLALADNANDEGVCWPSISNVALKCSVSERTAQYAIRALEQNGYLKTEKKPGSSSVYTITNPKTWRPLDAAGHLSSGDGVQDLHPRKICTPANPANARNSGHALGGGVQDLHQGGAGFAPVQNLRQGVQDLHQGGAESASATIEPSLNHQEPSGGERAGALDPPPHPSDDQSGSNKPPDPLDQAVAAWNAMAVEAGLIKVLDLTPGRRRQLAARIAECGGMEGWRRAMARVGSSSFLTGENPRGWKTDLGFIIDPDHFAKLREGGYGGIDAAADPDTSHDLLDGIPDELREPLRRAKIGAEDARRWFRGCRINGSALLVPKLFTRDWIETNYGHLLRRVLGDGLQITVEAA